MNDRIKILFFNLDQAGVSYFRTQTPAVQLDEDFNDKFLVEINSNINFSDYENALNYLKSFNIIHYHKSLVSDNSLMRKIVADLKSHNVVLVMDIDDYWQLDKTHPYFGIAEANKMHLDIIENIKMADYITTTTDLFASEIKKYNSNVIVLPNAINQKTMLQFQNNWKPDPNGLVRICYSAGSSHRYDVEQLKGVFNILNSDPDVKGKFKIILAGWDTRGETTDVHFNDTFRKELQLRGLWNSNIIKSINNSRGDINLIEGLPQDLREKYYGKVFNASKRPIKDEESVYFQYEEIFTDNYRIINDPEYVKFLKEIKRGSYPNETIYSRRWTRPANEYAYVLDETDILLAPLNNHKFNWNKSNLKQVEAFSRKLPIVCTDIPPYNIDGINNKNCLLIPYIKNNLINKNIDRDWAKAIKSLILSPELRKQLGEQLYEDFKIKYSLEEVTKKRASFYQSIVNVAVEL